MREGAVYFDFFDFFVHFDFSRSKSCFLQVVFIRAEKKKIEIVEERKM